MREERGGEDHCTSFFAVFGNVRTRHTTHDTKPNGKKTYQACWRLCNSCCCSYCCCCTTKSSSKGGTRDAANKTKQNKTKRSRAE